MSIDSGSVLIIDINGNVMAVSPGSAIPGSTTAFLMAGTDGTNARTMSVDTSGRPVFVGAGVAGTPAGGVISIQGVAGGTAMPVSGTITATNASIGTTGSAPPASATYIGGNDGTNLVGLKLKPASTAAVAADPSLVVALSPNSPIPTGANVIGAVTQSGTWTNTVTQATASNLNALVAQGAAGTAAAGWFVKLTDGTNTAPTFDVAARAGFQKITDGTNTAAVKAASTAPVATDPSLVVVLSPNQQAIPVTVAAGTDRTSTGTITNTQNVAINTMSSGTCGIQVTGVWTGTLVFEASVDNGTTWVSVNAVVPTTGVEVTSTTANGVWTAAVAGFAQLRVRGNTVATGTATVFLDSATGTMVVTLGDPLPTGANTIGAVTQGAGSGAAATYWYSRITDGTNTMPTMDTVARKGFQSITDGTNGPAAVKAASTAAVAADPSLVIALSPNSPIPTGSNVIGALTANQSVNVAQVAGSTTSVSAAGVQKVGIVGGAGGATVDATIAAGTAPTNGLGILGQYNTTLPAPTNGQTVGIQVDQAGNQLTFPGVQVKVGAAWNSGTSGGTLQYPTGTTTVGAPIGGASVLVQLDQTTTLAAGAVTFQGSYDGTNWVTIPAAQVLNPQTFAQLSNPYTFVASTNQPFLILLQGFQQIRANLSTPITGTGSVTPYWNTLSASSAGVVAQGTPAALSSAWATKITDGTNGPVAVKAASTAAVATDPALVVAISPNNTISTSNASVGATGSAPPASATYIAGFDGTNLVGLKLKPASTAALATDPSLVVTFSPNTGLPTGANVIGAVTQSGTWSVTATQTTAANLNMTAAQPTASLLNATIVGSGTGGTPATGVVTVQGISTMTPIITTEKRSTTGAITRVSASTSNATALASNTNRIAAVFFNEGAGIAYVKLGATASATSYTYKLSSNSSVQIDGQYTGQIDIIFSSNSGACQVTELT